MTSYDVSVDLELSELKKSKGETKVQKVSSIKLIILVIANA